MGENIQFICQFVRGRRRMIHNIFYYLALIERLECECWRSNDEPDLDFILCYQCRQATDFRSTAILRKYPMINILFGIVDTGQRVFLQNLDVFHMHLNKLTKRNLLDLQSALFMGTMTVSLCSLLQNQYALIRSLTILFMFTKGALWQIRRSNFFGTLDP